MGAQNEILAGNQSYLPYETFDRKTIPRDSPAFYSSIDISIEKRQVRV